MPRSDNRTWKSGIYSCAKSVCRGQRRDRTPKIKATLGSLGCEAAIITSPENVFYLSGFTGGADGCLVITDDALFIITDTRYTVQAGLEAPEYTLVSGSSANAALIAETVKKTGKTKIAFENRHMTVALYSALREHMQCELVPLDSALTCIRAVKEEREVRKIREALRLADEAFEYAVSRIRRDMRETDVAAMLEGYMRQNGASKTAFDTICASGARGAMPHGTATASPLESGFLVMDYGCILDGYCSDITRTVCIGEPDGYMKKMYNTVLEAQLAAEKMLSAGVTGYDADKVAREKIAESFDSSYFSHSLGHGVGLYIHELPNLSPSNKTPLEQGNIVTVEPGIYIKDLGGVRIEDMALITANGAEILTKSSKELMVIS